MNDQPEALCVAQVLESDWRVNLVIAVAPAAARLLREQHAEIKRLKAERDGFYMDYRVKCDEKTKAQYDEIERLREAVTKYGRHLHDCVGMLGGYQCTCGFNQQGVKP